MSLVTKTVLLSALVCPGAGYFAVAAVKRGLAFVVLTLSCLGVVLRDVHHKAQFIAQKILDGEIPYDIATIREQIESAPGLYEPDVMIGVLSALALLWIVGIVDTGRIALRVVAEQPSASEDSG